MQENLHRRNREETCGPLPRAPTRRRKKNNTDASKPVAQHFNLPNLSHHNMTISGLSLHHGNTEIRKNLEQKLIFQLCSVHSVHTELMNASHSPNSFTNSFDHISTNGKAPLHSSINQNTPQFLYSLWRRANARNVSVLNVSRW